MAERPPQRRRQPARAPKPTSGRARPPAAARKRPPARKRPAPRPAVRRRGAFSRFVRATLVALVLLVLAVAVTGCAVYASMSSQLPDPDLTKAKGRDQSSVILDSHGAQLARLYAEENRQDVQLSKMPTQLRQAVIATEDRRFYEHTGVDPIGITRALLTDVITRRRAQGGSTITQQYVKQAFVTSEKTLKRKVQEAILAQKVEKRFTKDQILGLYLNTIYFGHGAYGVEAASRAYFGKGVTALDLPQAAMIAGVIKSPGLYSPYLHPDAAKKRRDTVLSQMLAQGYIDQSAYRKAVDSPIKTAGLKARAAKAPYFVEWVKQQLIAQYGENAVYRGGLRVRTTLDLKVQSAAEKAIADVLDHKGDPSASVVAIDPQTGAVIAMVGGRDFAKQQFNVAVQGRRQPGSAFKPFVLATALEQGVSPDKSYKSGPMRLKVGDQTWKVTGASGATTSTTMRLRQATEKSVNSVFAQLILEIGPEKVVETAEKLGIHKGIEPVPAIALGGLEQGVSPLEMASAFGTFAVGGKHAQPFGILEVDGSKGKVLMRHKTATTTAIDPAVAFLTTDILTGVIKRGTGTGAAIGRPAAGKTGTTQEYRDAWFVGYTPQLSTAVWIGYPEAQREMKSVHGRTVTGGSFPADIWSRFMKAALKGVEIAQFDKPTGLVRVKVCSESGGLATAFCPKTESVLVLAGKEPTPCTLHTKPLEVVVPNVVGQSKADALVKLQALALKVSVVEKDVAGVEVGLVAEQSLKAGTKVKPDTAITLTVSTGGSQNNPPVANFSAPQDARAGKPVKLDASASTDDGKIATYYWEFGDGATGNGKVVTHAWTTPGTYEVTLWVTDDRGGQASSTVQVNIR